MLLLLHFINSVNFKIGILPIERKRNDERFNSAPLDRSTVV